MLNALPQLITYSIFVPTILRVLVAISFFYIAYAQISRRKEISETSFQFIGKPDATFVVIIAALAAAVGFFILVGMYTQLAALAGMVLSIKHAIYAKKYPRAVPLCRGEYIYLIVILFTLVISGAGLLAVDIPQL